MASKCSKCKNELILTKGKMGLGSLCILLFFTMGIGLIFYSIYYGLKQEDRCRVCNVRFVKIPNNNQEKSEDQISIIVLEEYCQFCGKALENNNCLSCGMDNLGIAQT